MKLSKAVKTFLAADLMIGLTITCLTWMTLGTEGLAAKYCSWTHAKRCDDIEWSEEEDADESPRPIRANSQTQEDEKKAQASRREIRLRYGL